MKFLKNTFFTVSIFARRNTPKTSAKRLQLDWSNDVVTLSPARSLPIIIFESALSRPSKKIGRLDWWTYLGRGRSHRSAGRRIYISSSWCQWKISPPQKNRSTKKAWHRNINSSDLNNRIWEDRKLSNLMHRQKNERKFILQKVWWSINYDGRRRGWVVTRCQSRGTGSTAATSDANRS